MLYAMVNISRHQLHAHVLEKIYDQFDDVMIANVRKRDISKTMYELLSYKERILLAKRLAIIGMLMHNQSTRDISMLLKVSTATVARIENELEMGTYAHIASIFKRKKHRESFLGLLETVFTVGMYGNPNKVAADKMKRAIESWRAGG